MGRARAVLSRDDGVQAIRREAEARLVADGGGEEEGGDHDAALGLAQT